MPDIAYVSSGKLHLKFGDAAPRQIESKFAHDARERLIRVQQRHAWKNEGTSARFQGRMLWAAEPREEDIAPCSISSITRGERESHVLYSLSGTVNGLFAFDPETKIERRIIHGVEHDYDDLAYSRNLDFLLFPVRLLVALMQYLNFFSAKYSGKPLTTAGNMKKKGVDMRQMMVWENLIRADETKDADDPQATVPRTWQLIRQRGVKMETVARSVAAFDVAADGTIVYSVGDALYCVAPDGAKCTVCNDPMITHVAFV